MAAVFLSAGTPTALSASGCVPGEYVTTANYSSTIWRSAAFVGPSMPPDVVVQRGNGTNPATWRYNGTTGRRIWGPSFSGGGVAGVLVAERGRTLVEVVDGGGCGAVVVRKVSATTGRVLWSAKLAGIATRQRPDVDVRSPGVGDINGDGVADVPVVRTAQDTVAPFMTHCVEQPSGACREPGTSWASRLDVLDGRNGRLLFDVVLGEARAGMPSATWARRGNEEALAVVVPRDHTAADLALYRGRKPDWQLPLDAVGSDTALSAGGTTLLAMTSALGLGTLSIGPVVVAIDPSSGALRWTRRIPGGGVAFPVGTGDVISVDLPTGTVTRLRGTAGSDVWRSAPYGPLRMNAYPVGDIDGRGSTDVAVPLYDETVVVASEDGKVLIDVPERPQLFASPDLTGDKTADLLVVDDPLAEVPNVALHRGRDLRRLWNVAVPLGESRNAVLVDAAGATNGSVIVHSMNGKRFVLSARDGKVRWTLPGDQ